MKPTLLERARELRDGHAALIKTNTELVDAAEAENRDLTAEEKTEFDARLVEIKGLQERFERLEEQAAADSGISDPPPAPAGVPSPRATGSPGPNEHREFRDLHDFLTSVIFAPSDQRLQDLYHEQEISTERRAEMERRGQSMGTGTQGGFAVPQQWRDQLLSVDQQGAVIRPGATTIPAGSPPDAGITMPALDQTPAKNMYGGVEVTWIGEAQEKPETEFALLQVTLEPNEVAASLPLTDKLLRNWTAAASTAETLLSRAMLAAEDHAFLQGDGTGKPLGIINSPAAIPINRTTASAIKYADIQAMYSKLRMDGSPIWVASQEILPQLLDMQDNSGATDGKGQYIFQPSPREGVQPQLMGFPIFWNERSPRLGLKGDLTLINRAYYLIKDGSGPFVAASEHVEFRKNRTWIKAFWNVDGQPWLKAPITNENGYQVSPFIVLDVPS